MNSNSSTKSTRQSPMVEKMQSLPQSSDCSKNKTITGEPGEHLMSDHATLPKPTHAVESTETSWNQRDAPQTTRKRARFEDDLDSVDGRPSKVCRYDHGKTESFGADFEMMLENFVSKQLISISKRCDHLEAILTQSQSHLQERASEQEVQKLIALSIQNASDKDAEISDGKIKDFEMSQIQKFEQIEKEIALKASEQRAELNTKIRNLETSIIPQNLQPLHEELARLKSNIFQHEKRLEECVREDKIAAIASIRGNSRKLEESHNGPMNLSPSSQRILEAPMRSLKESSSSKNEKIRSDMYKCVAMLQEVAGTSSISTYASPKTPGPSMSSKSAPDWLHQKVRLLDKNMQWAASEIKSSRDGVIPGIQKRQEKQGREYTNLQRMMDDHINEYDQHIRHLERQHAREKADVEKQRARDRAEIQRLSVDLSTIRKDMVKNYNDSTKDYDVLNEHLLKAENTITANKTTTDVAITKLERLSKANEGDIAEVKASCQATTKDCGTQMAKLESRLEKRFQEAVSIDQAARESSESKLKEWIETEIQDHHFPLVKELEANEARYARLNELLKSQEQRIEELESRISHHSCSRADCIGEKTPDHRVDCSQPSYSNPLKDMQSLRFDVDALTEIAQMNAVDLRNMRRHIEMIPTMQESISRLGKKWEREKNKTNDQVVTRSE